MTKTHAEEKQEEKLKIRVEVSARGHVDLEMTRAEFDERFPDGGQATAALEDLVTDWDDLLSDLEFEVEDAYPVAAKAGE